MKNQITLIVTITSKSEHRARVREILCALAAKTVQEPGNLCYVLHEVDDNPDQFVIYEKWENQASLDFHMEQDYLKAFLEQEDALLSTKIAGKFCTEIKEHSAS